MHRVLLVILIITCFTGCTSQQKSYTDIYCRYFALIKMFEENKNIEPYTDQVKLVLQAFDKELEKIQKFNASMGTVSFKPFDPNDPLSRIGQQEVFLVRAEADGTSTILTDWYQTEFIPMDH